jgi:hypothetical protein
VKLFVDDIGFFSNDLSSIMMQSSSSEDELSSKDLHLSRACKSDMEGVTVRISLGLDDDILLDVGWEMDGVEQEALESILF